MDILAAPSIVMTGMHLDTVVPRWQFRERHATHVAAAPEAVFAAIRAIRAEDILFFRTMVAIRCGFRRGKESILNPPKDTPILDVATRTGFRYLANDPPREVVIGINVANGVLAAMNFHVEPDASGSMLSTETRVFSETRRGMYRFGAYWFVIRMGSGFIRRMWLRAIRIRAERV
ncbi:MAG: hypothetical protein JJE51_08470 [Thermoanaerobaculia bacterium]|nr:hypothetical protein [Thermoanaerobaculia bacterium]